MPTTHLSTHGDLPAWAVIVACVLATISLVLLVVELRRRERGGFVVAVSGLLALGTLLLSILRPVRVTATENVVGARIVVLADMSRSMALPDGASPRTERRDAAIDALQRSAHDARFVLYGFGDKLEPYAKGAISAGRSDLTSALHALRDSPDEHPAAIVVVSDGRLDDPPEGATHAMLQPLEAELHVPIHTIATTHATPADASIRRVTASGAAVAHVPLPLRIEIGCAGTLACDELTVTARELHHDGAPTLLASGLAHVKDGSATLELPITLERAGVRVVEIAISGASGDAVPENDRRLLTFSVSRERIRVLHVAGRPTNDVRALRQWLKGDASIDLVAFFILRRQTNNVNARQEELALIPFPVDELFSEHLPSFDAVVLQDFDAQPYGLEQHLPALANYVRSGGGLVMVGGPNSFIAGGYAGTPLAEVLPVQLDSGSDVTAADPSPFVPAWSDIGHDAPMLEPLRHVLGEELPQMPGANVLEDARPNALVLWTHPRRRTRSHAPMPVLAISDVGNGRSIALGVDGGWMLDFSDLGARTGGRGHGALWDGLLGWLMRDPRFEPAQVELPDGCVANEPAKLRIRATLAKGAAADVAVYVTRMDGEMEAVHLEKKAAALGAPFDLTLPPLPPGGYSALLHVGSGVTTRHDFACEAGGDEWADSRPDEERLRTIAEATRGSFHAEGDHKTLPLPKATVVSTERHVAPVAPPWAWALLAAMCVGAHWYARRKSGLT